MKEIEAAFIKNAITFFLLAAVVMILGYSIGYHDAMAEASATVRTELAK